MTSNIIRYDQDQQHLLPKNVAEWVEEDSLERYVSGVINYLDNEGRLDSFYPEDREDGCGRPSFHPVMMLKIHVFGYCIGIRSSRKSSVSLNVTSLSVTLPRINTLTSVQSASSARTTARVVVNRHTALDFTS
ncbi:transposase [Natrinema salsiterrestre]|uniref:Transposase n=1 Tax=Natrinema salsiterrestre TaxID=2950540 RepID=A0A9Q4Q1U4_9EURY|nr:transposase [Natrinema salsiterrestre]MDF9748440.1 transposase [Natrinema salsiterrestre]